ncbi:hypothetical protein LTS18_013146, partial [Coniosporium uncinatum]
MSSHAQSTERGSKHHRRDGRSRSPHRERKLSHRQRSRSPSHKSSRHEKKHEQSSKPAILPLKARPLSKRDYDQHKAMFALYLDIQKQILLEDLDEREAKGRWKSFVGKWNRGELAEG